MPHKLFTLESKLFDPSDFSTNNIDIKEIIGISNGINEQLIKFIAKHITRIINNKDSYPVYIENYPLQGGILKQVSLFNPINRIINDSIQSELTDVLYSIVKTAIKVLELESDFYFDYYDINENQDKLCNTNSHGSDNKLSISVKYKQAYDLAHQLSIPLKRLYEYDSNFTFKLTVADKIINLFGLITLNKYINHNSQNLEQIQFQNMKYDNQSTNPDSFLIELKGTSTSLKLIEIPIGHLELARRLARYKDPGTVIGFRQSKKIRLDEKGTGKFIVTSLHRPKDIGQQDIFNKY